MSTFELDFGVKVTQNDDQYPLHHVSYAATTFEIAKANGLRSTLNLAWLLCDF